MRHDEAMGLWLAFVNHIGAAEELSAEGNSGEFHSEEEDERLAEAVAATFCRLVDAFSKATGWRPVQKAPECENTGEWVLYQVQPTNGDFSSQRAQK